MNKVLIGRILISLIFLPLAGIGIASTYTKFYTVSILASAGALWGVIFILILWGLGLWFVKDAVGAFEY